MLQALLSLTTGMPTDVSYSSMIYVFDWPQMVHSYFDHRNYSGTCKTVQMYSNLKSDPVSIGNCFNTGRLGMELRDG